MNFLKNYFSTLSFIFFWFIYYSQSNAFKNFLGWDLSFVFSDFTLSKVFIFYVIIWLYIVLLVPFYLYYTGPSKARHVYKYLWKIISWNINYTFEEKNSVLAWLVKLFFAPLMIVWLSDHIFNMINNLYNSYLSIDVLGENFLLFFNNNFFYLAFSLILFADVLFFTLWYLLEAPALKNTIRSVEPTLIGWAVAILCYPPLNGNVSYIFSWYSTDFPSFGNPYIHIWLNIAILLLMGIYAWASVSLGLKASNLTNRWIVSRWPYKYIRHPAYVCKNLAWLIGGIPMILLSFGDPKINTLVVVLSLSAWLFLYFMRAMTEEAHLSADPDYLAYKKKVPYKFIPKVW